MGPALTLAANDADHLTLTLPDKSIALSIFTTQSAISHDLIEAYRETDFRVVGSLAFTLKVGEFNQQLATLHRMRGVQTSAFITACNPFSQNIGDATNAERLKEMAAQLQALGHNYLDGMGRHPSNRWPGEQSFLVLGLSLQAATMLGAQYGQNAIVWSGEEAVPELVLLLLR